MPADCWGAWSHRDLARTGAHHLLPMHWGTFDQADEPIDEADRELARLLAGEARDLADRVTRLPIGGAFRPASS